MFRHATQYFKQEMYRCCKITVVNSRSHQLSADRSSLTPRVYESQLSGRVVGYTEMCIQESEVGGAGVDGFKSYAPFSLPRALYSSGVACSHIKSSPTCSAVEVIRRPYISSRFSALYLAHSFSVRLLTSGEAIPNRRNDRIVARTLMLCCC